MANHKTGAQRYNDRMDKIFARSKELNEKYHGKDSFGSGDHRSDAMKKAIHAKSSKKLKVKSKGSSGFDKSWKIWQKEGGKSEKVVHLKGYDKDARKRALKKKINPDDIPL